MIQENILDVEYKIRKACEKSNRDPKDITLIAVSKTKPISDIKEVLDYGHLHFGENKVQELLDKYEVLPNNIKWHMIGHLQRNKVKYILDKVCLIHSLDSVRLAEQINLEAAKINTIVDVLVQVNVSKEETKFGIEYSEVEAFIRKVSEFPNIRVKGLMTIAMFTENPEDNRPYFKKLNELYVDIKSKSIDNVSMDILSMGMTGDYEVAVEEGATMVRVGTGIFGERFYR